jgi:metallo-beta-lactamase family protein
MTRKLKLTFCGGVGTVTGANFLIEDIESAEPFRFLVDCGMVQGEKFANDENHKAFLYNPAIIDCLLVTHAHIDHIGRIPKLVRDGFRGEILSTPETKSLTVLMFEDALKLMRQEVEEKGGAPLYDERDVAETVSLWKTVPYHTNHPLKNGISIYLKDAGHVLGSAMYEISCNGTKMVFTGDLGNSPTPILKDTEEVEGAKYLVMESVYGDRNHENISQRRDRLERVIQETAKRGGALVIPAFSLEKTQVLLSEINTLVESGAIPQIPVFLDSPLAIKITEIYKAMKKDFNQEARDTIAGGDDIFRFPMLHFTEHSEQSRSIRHTPNPKIIIAGSGMSNGGRIIHHEKNYIGDPKSTILFIGYQAVGSLGRRIQEGDKRVSIEGEEFEVKAHIDTISGYSSHKGSDQLIEFVEESAKTLKEVFVVMGEPKSALFLVQRIRDYLNVQAKHPELGESVILEF